MQKTITIPETMERWIEVQIRSGRYATDSEYIRDLLRKDQERFIARAELQRLIQEGLDSGISDKSVQDILSEARAEIESEVKIQADG